MRSFAVDDEWFWRPRRAWRQGRSAASIQNPHPVLFAFLVVGATLAPYAVGLFFVYLLLPVIRWFEHLLPSIGCWGRVHQPLAVSGTMVVAVAGVIAALDALQRAVEEKTARLPAPLPQTWDTLLTDHENVRELILLAIGISFVLPAASKVRRLVVYVDSRLEGAKTTDASAEAVPWRNGLPSTGQA
jgi:predicted PurR-regulated permease PerM